VKTLLATIHVAFVGCRGNLVYRVVSWIPVLGNLWEVPVEGSHKSILVQTASPIFAQNALQMKHTGTIASSLLNTTVILT
jgi:hypothetical protein